MSSEPPPSLAFSTVIAPLLSKFTKGESTKHLIKFFIPHVFDKVGIVTINPE